MAKKPSRKNHMWDPIHGGWKCAKCKVKQLVKRNPLRTVYIPRGGEETTTRPNCT